MKYSTQHKYKCSEAYDKWALKNPRAKARQAYMAACRTCIEGFSEWISVDDGLPVHDRLVLLVDSCGLTGTGYVAIEGTGWWYSCSRLPAEVTHWMPLPEPPIDPTTGTKTPEE